MKFGIFLVELLVPGCLTNHGFKDFLQFFLVLFADADLERDIGNFGCFGLVEHLQLSKIANLLEGWEVLTKGVSIDGHSVKADDQIRDHLLFVVAGVPGIRRNRVSVDPNLNFAIAIQSDHLFTDPHATILAHEAFEGLEDLHMVFRSGGGEREHLICVYVVDIVTVMVVEEHPADGLIVLLHAFPK